MKELIITFLLIGALCFACDAQYLEKGTLTTDSASYELRDKYIQDAQEEVKQRKKINFLQKKIEKLKHITSHKSELLTKQEELLDTIMTLEATVEALREENALLHKEIIDSSLASIDLANAELARLDKKIKRLRKQKRLLIIILAAESICLVLIIA